MVKVECVIDAHGDDKSVGRRMAQVRWCGGVRWGVRVEKGESGVNVIDYAEMRMLVENEER